MPIQNHLPRLRGKGLAKKMTRCDIGESLFEAQNVFRLGRDNGERRLKVKDY